jgi:hypothetical protein
MGALCTTCCVSRPFVHDLVNAGPIHTENGRNILQQRYQLSELDAGTDASYLLAGSVILYPIVSFPPWLLLFYPIAMIFC